MELFSSIRIMQKNTRRFLVKLRSLEHGGPFTSCERADGLHPVSASDSPLNTGFCSGTVPSAFILGKYILFLTRNSLFLQRLKMPPYVFLLSASVRDAPGPLSKSLCASPESRTPSISNRRGFLGPAPVRLQPVEAGIRAGLLSLVCSAGFLPPLGSEETGLDKLPGRHSFRPSRLLPVRRSSTAALTRSSDQGDAASPAL